MSRLLPNRLASILHLCLAFRFYLSAQSSSKLSKLSTFVRILIYVTISNIFGGISEIAAVRAAARSRFSRCHIWKDAGPLGRVAISANVYLPRTNQLLHPVGHGCNYLRSSTLQSECTLFCCLRQQLALPEGHHNTGSTQKCANAGRVGTYEHLTRTKFQRLLDSPWKLQKRFTVKLFPINAFSRHSAVDV